jgi:RAB protein geranylgeranyltransferase component A
MRAEEAPIEAPECGAFDLVVLGTGLVEALIAGCVALRRVTHAARRCVLLGARASVRVRMVLQ